MKGTSYNVGLRIIFHLGFFPPKALRNITAKKKASSRVDKARESKDYERRLRARACVGVRLPFGGKIPLIKFFWRRYGVRKYSPRFYLPDVLENDSPQSWCFNFSFKLWRWGEWKMCFDNLHVFIIFLSLLPIIFTFSPTSAIQLLGSLPPHLHPAAHEHDTTGCD